MIATIAVNVNVTVTVNVSVNVSGLKKKGWQATLVVVVTRTREDFNDEI